MKRRTLLTTGVTGAVLSASGCLDGVESLVDNGDEGVSDCSQVESWDDGSGGPSDPAPDSIAGCWDCADANRPEPTGDVCAEHEVQTADGATTYESLGVASYPDPPSSFDDEVVAAFVEEYERAYSQNELVLRFGDRVVEGGAMLEEDETEPLDWYDDIAVVGLEFGVGHTEVTGGGLGATDPVETIAVYGVDETGIVRAAAPEHTVGERGDIGRGNRLDPIENGDLLACL
ncbi:hypothetical protein OB905_02715 [Halobacteria archaeon AArc-dxtr1]|nr:hypothetical protein [Halobacteria archaeon AArc-dxtr1]